MRGVVHNNSHFTGKKAGRSKPHKKKIRKKSIHRNKYGRKGGHNKYGISKTDYENVGVGGNGVPGGIFAASVHDKRADLCAENEHDAPEQPYHL